MIFEIVLGPQFEEVKELQPDGLGIVDIFQLSSHLSLMRKLYVVS
jgi:hypothetical protein